MPEYTYLLETRLTAPQRNALFQVKEAVREAGSTVFLAGGAVRDLTTGSSVRDLDFSVQGNALELEPLLVARGGMLWGKQESTRTLFFCFPGSVRVEVASTRAESYPKPGEPVYRWTGMVDDLHRRDFTANAMALSLNEGSYGLLLDPLNGVADLEARQLRLVNNYGFLEDPSRLVRAVRLRHRLGWTLEERTQVRYENAKEADNFGVTAAFLRGYELEELAAEEDALTAMQALEEEGWMDKLLPGWTSAAADTGALEDLHRNRIQLLMQGIAPDLAAAQLEVLTAKLPGETRATLKELMVRPGLRAQWEGLEAAAKEFAKLLTGKEAASPSATWKLMHSHAAEPVLWLAHTKKAPAVEAKFRNFFTVWPEAAKKVPVAMMLEMRITPKLPQYEELLRELFLEQIDGKLETDEQIRAFLEPYSPPAPPPPVTLRRSRAKKAESKGKRKGAARDEDPDADPDEDAEEPDERDPDEDEDESRPVREEDDESDDEEDEEDLPAEKVPVVAAGLGAGKKLNLDKVDLSAVLGRIEEEVDQDADAEGLEGGATDGEKSEGAETGLEEPSVSSGAPKPATQAKPAAAQEETNAAKPVPSGKKAAVPAKEQVVKAAEKTSAKPLTPAPQAAKKTAAPAALAKELGKPVAVPAKTVPAATKVAVAAAKPSALPANKTAAPQKAEASAKQVVSSEKGKAAVAGRATPAKQPAAKPNSAAPEEKPLAAGQKPGAPQKSAATAKQAAKPAEASVKSMKPAVVKAGTKPGKR